jgi:2'-5' RNA ligase
MAEALVGVLDAGARGVVEGLRRRLVEVGVAAGGDTAYPAHVTFAVADRVGEAAVRAAEAAGATGRSGGGGGLEVTLDAMGVFCGDQGVLFLGVTPTTELVAAHGAVHAALDGDGGGPHGHFRPGVWVPHCTLAAGLDGPALGRAVTGLHPVRGIRARVAAWEVVRLTAAGGAA